MCSGKRFSVQSSNTFWLFAWIYLIKFEICHWYTNEYTLWIILSVINFKTLVFFMNLWPKFINRIVCLLSKNVFVMLYVLWCWCGEPLSATKNHIGFLYTHTNQHVYIYICSSVYRYVSNTKILHIKCAPAYFWWFFIHPYLNTWLRRGLKKEYWNEAGEWVS